MHSPGQTRMRIRSETGSLVSTFQVIEFLLNLRWPLTLSLATRPQLARDLLWSISLTHRFIHTVAIASEECWKKNHLARNSELGVMIRDATESVFDTTRNRFDLMERR
jgi:hypothetical protein